MTKITIYQDKNDKITGFKIKGHAGYAESGSDVVCAAISVLVINAMNSIETFTNARFLYDENEKKGYMKYIVQNSEADGCQLLLNSLVLGLSELEKECDKKYVRLKFKEV